MINNNVESILFSKLLKFDSPFLLFLLYMSKKNLSLQEDDRKYSIK